MGEEKSLVGEIKKTAGKLSLFILGCLLCILISELSLRYVWTGWRKAWDAKQRFSYKNPPEQNQFRVDHARYFVKSPNTFRIIVLGDSYTFGDGVYDAGNIYTACLRRRLKKIYPRVNMEVVNLGVGGFSTFNEAELLSKIGPMLKPDLVMVQFVSNDMEISWPRYGHVHTLDYFKIDQDIINNKPVHQWLLKHSYLYCFINEKYFRMQVKYKIPANYCVDENYSGWQQFKYAVNSINAFCYQNNIGSPVFVLFPMFHKGKWTVQTFPEALTHRKVAEFLSQTGIYVLDLLPAYTKTNKDLREFWALQLDQHPNEKAHYLAALEIEDFLVKGKIIENRFKDLKLPQ
ncbi:MAG: SGNH/GDSL hydrolase family protein [Candidatus Omnitrophica bacterium]|jgi:hypothetical protein|nr:SGNH/GDSL hydrolase family protein [Candidatus Omnitrophota bacterium]